MTGEVIIDDRLFDHTESTGSGPSRVSPIMINDNVVDVLVQPGKAAGEPAFVSFRPPTQFVTMDAEVKTVAEEQAAELKVGSIDSRRFTVREVFLLAITGWCGFMRWTIPRRSRGPIHQSPAPPECACERQLPG